MPKMMPDQLKPKCVERVFSIVEFPPVHSRPVNQLNAAGSAPASWTLLELLFSHAEAMKVVLTTRARARYLQRY